MKFSFKRIASVLTGAIMLSSTVAFAAAADVFPKPFVVDGKADAAVVYGALGVSGDQVKAQEIAKKLGSLQLAAATTVTPSTVETSGDGDKLSLGKENSRLYLGNTTSTAFSRAVTDQDLPTLLKDGTFLDTDGDEFDYTQKVDINPLLQVTQFSDSDYEDSKPTLGVRVANGAEVLNYTLDFSENPSFDDTLETQEINLMGKEYFILTQTNTSNQEKLTLLDSATTVVVPEGETKQVTVGGQTYSVSVDVSSTTVKVTVNGKTSTSLAIGGTFKVGGGVYAGVKDISYKSKESAVSNAEISIGTGKLVLENTAEVELNEETVSGLYAYITQTSNKLDKVKIQWKVDEDEFITPTSSLEMPGFKALKLSATGMKYAGEEEITVENDGSDTIQLKVPLKDGEATLDVLSLNATDVYGVIGKDSSNILRTGTTSITFDGDTDEWFPVSWTNNKDYESYLLRANTFANNSGTIQADIERWKDGAWVDLQQKVAENDHVTIGNIDITVGAIDRSAKTIVLTATGASFSTLYTDKGLKINLPYDSATSTAVGVVNLTANPTSYLLRFTEADSVGNIGNGNAFTLTLSRADSNTKAHVSAVSAVSGTTVSSAYETEDGSEEYVTQVYSPLATTIVHDQEPTQQTAKVIYHGGESYFELMLTAPTVSVGSGSGTGTGSGFLPVSDAELAKFQNNNLIVVGGSCINTVAAKLLGSTTPLCGADFTAKTGVKAGEYLVKTYKSPYNEAKVATLVAGYEAAETGNAVDWLLVNSNVEIADGSEYLNGIKKTVSA